MVEIADTNCYATSMEMTDRFLELGTLQGDALFVRIRIGRKVS